MLYNLNKNKRFVIAHAARKQISIILFVYLIFAVYKFDNNNNYNNNNNNNINNNNNN